MKHSSFMAFLCKATKRLMMILFHLLWPNWVNFTGWYVTHRSTHGLHGYFSRAVFIRDGIFRVSTQRTFWKNGHFFENFNGILVILEILTYFGTSTTKNRLRQAKNLRYFFRIPKLWSCIMHCSIPIIMPPWTRCV